MKQFQRHVLHLFPARVLPLCFTAEKVLIGSERHGCFFAAQWSAPPS